MLLTVIGFLGGLIALTSNIPYIYDITTKKTTKPHRVTWGIFFLLNVIFFANQLAAGATSSIWLVVAFMLSTFTIFCLSLKYGVGGTSKLDWLILSGAVIGVVVWQLLRSPLASIIANLIVASIASIPTYKKAWQNPATETKASYGLGAVAALLALIAVGKLQLDLLLLPTYSLIYQGSVYLILSRHYRR